MSQYEHDEELMIDIYTLVDEEGNEQEFELLDEMELDGVLYYALIPHYEEGEDILEDDEEFVVLRVEEQDGEEMLVSIDDEDEHERIGTAFLERIVEVFEEETEAVNGQLQ